MAPRKKSNSATKKSSSNQNNSNQQSQPHKFGIQHFFEKHSQNQSQNPKKPLKPSNSYPNSDSILPAPQNPPVIACKLKNGAASIQTKPCSNTKKSDKPSPKKLPSSTHKTVNSNGLPGFDAKFLGSSCKKLEGHLGRGANSSGKLESRGDFKENEVGNRSHVSPDVNRIPVVIDVNANEGDDLSEVSPEVSIRKPPKRVKFSPGMLIKQSQDDVGNDVTWKISPVNERLHSMSKQFPGMIKDLADSSPFRLLNLKQCSQRNTSSCAAGKLEKWLSSPPLKPAEKSFTRSDTGHSTNLSISQSACTSDNVESKHSKGRSQVNSSHSPFKTPPSLSYCNDKQSDGVDIEGPFDKLGLRPHKKALIELLDQVEDVLSVEMPANDEKRGCNEVERFEKCDSGLVLESKDRLNHESLDLYFLVLEVSEKHGCLDSSGSLSPCKNLRLLNEQTGEERIVQLWHEWFNSIVAPGDTVHIIGEYDSSGKCDVNHEKNFLIVHPDILVSGTRVAASFSCSRRTVLDERLKGREYSSAALIGTLVHQIFQAGLINESPSQKYLEDYAKVVLQRNLEMLYACGVNENDILKTLLEAIPKLLNWISAFRDSEESRSPSVDFGSEAGVQKIKISEVVDIEEMAWAPRYGLKGMVDASLRVKVHLEGKQATENIMPLEFKTGKGNGQIAVEHNAQVMLYMLLMSERYQKNIDHGLLYYLQTDKTQGITVRRSDLIGLLMRRNELATHLLRALTMQQLPEMLQSLNICRSCRHLDACSIYHKAYGGTKDGSGMGDLFDSLVQHLKSSDTDFLRKWNRLIDLEAKESEVTKRQTWVSHNLGNDNYSGSLSSLVLESSEKMRQRTSSKGNRFIYRFVLQDLSLESSAPVKSSFGCTLRPGDYVILSIECGHLPVANGIIVDIGTCHVTVSFSKPLRRPGSNSSVQDLTECTWRIDKDEALTSFAVMRFNLVQLFLQNEESAHLRKMIVGLEAPRFDSGCVLSQDPAISYIWSEKTLNDDQRGVILKILAARDYSLILGMPGTGKTSTMVHAVKALLMRGASILLTSYTNSAVDNLLIKLKAQGIDFLRIGRCDAVHEEVQGNCLAEMDMHSLEDIKLKIDQARVIGVTCLGITSPLLAKKKFDVCLMDEAGQITLPVSLGPLMFASKFVLVGDHYQLPPLVQSVEARENGMGTSLFSRLSEAHPEAISALRSQYRMCAGIMDLSNALIYGNRLCCGSAEVASAKIICTHAVSLPEWLSKVLCPHRPVVFVNTDLLPAFESKDSKAINNPVEAYIVSQITTGLVDVGIEGEDIGIITPYNSQASLIRQAVSASVETHTIDKYQGRDKDCILVSFVRSSENPRNCSSSLLGDWHRINVAITRAKKKLIMVGSCRTLSKVPLLKLLIERVEDQSGILTISEKEIKLKPELKRCSYTTG